MERTPVDSDRFRSVGHDETRNRLEIEFRDGRVFQYFGVPRDEYRGLVESSSPGRYFLRHIKSSYRYREVD